MTQSYTAVRGTVLNRDQQAVQRLSGVPVKASTDLTKGTLVYEDGSNGWTTAPTDGSVIGKHMWFVDGDADNDAGAKGDKIVDVWKTGAMVIGKADGAIVVGRSVKAGTGEAGCFMENTEPTAPGNTYVEAAADSLADHVKHHVGRYIGHVDEIFTSNTSRTDAVDNEADCVFLLD